MLRPAPGFSLVELLVVIAIIALLLTLLAPFVSSAIGKGHATHCLNNMRQWALAVRAYEQDGHDELPSEGQGSSVMVTEADAWFNVLPRYIDVTPIQNVLAEGETMPRPKDKSVFVCQAVPTADAAAIPPTKPYLSYAQNLYIEDRARAANNQLAERMRFREVDYPNQTVYLAEVEGPDFANVDGRFVVYRHGTRKPKAAPSGVKGKNSTANFAFLDGHAATYRWQDIYVTARSQNKTVIWDPTAPLLD